MFFLLTRVRVTRGIVPSSLLSGNTIKQNYFAYHPKTVPGLRLQ